MKRILKLAPSALGMLVLVVLGVGLSGLLGRMVWKEGAPAGSQPGSFRDQLGVTPGAPVTIDLQLPGEEMQPTLTPRPQPTRDPGVTQAAYPLQPGRAASPGLVLYAAGANSPQALALGRAGEGASALVPELVFAPLIGPASPDGRYLTLLQPVEPGGIPYVLTRDTGSVWPLLQGHPLQAEITGWVYGWHPDSRQVFFWSFSAEALWLVDTETGEVRELAVTTGNVQGAALSPDGLSVVYINHGPDSTRAMWRLSTAGGDARVLFDLGGPSQVYSFSPDGRYVLYAGPGAPLWITVFNAAGAASCGGIPLALPPHAMATVQVGACGPAMRTAVVSGGGDVSVAVSHRRMNPDASAAYTAIDQPRSSVYIPLLMRDNYGLDRRIYLQNAGSAATRPTIRFRPAPGFAGSPDTYTLSPGIPPGGHAMVDLDDLADLGGVFIGSAQITASQPLAVSWTQYLGDSLLQESGMAGGTGQKAYAPLVQNDNWGLISDLVMQNASGQNDQLLTLRYHRKADGRVCATRYQTLDRRYAAVYPGPPYQGNPAVPCSAVLSAVISGEGSNTAGMVSQILPGTMVATDYPAIASPGQQVALPVLWKSWVDRDSGFVVQNVTGQPTAVTVSYYLSDGSRACAHDFALDRLGESQVVYPLPNCVGSGFYGSAVVSADREVAVVANHLFGTAGDNSLSHIGVHR